jgi:hypothetical protein
MSYFPLLVILPNHIAHKDDFEQYVYIVNVLEKYNESIECSSYVAVTKDKLELEFEENKDDYESIEELCKKWYGCILDKDGNAVSTFNKDSLFAGWRIGGKFNKQIKESNDDFIIVEEDIESHNYKPIYTIKDNSVSIDIFLSKLNQWNHHIVDHNGTLHKYIDEIPTDQWNGMMLSILGDCENGSVVLIECEF